MALIQGKGFYTKVLGKPQPAYDKTKNEWSFDLALDKAGLAEAKRLGFAEKIKSKGDDRGQYITFRRAEFKGDGEVRNQPFKVVDHHGKPWDDKKLIGNGSILNVRYNVYPGRKGNKPVALAIQVWELVPYLGKNDFPTKESGTADDFTTAAPEETAEDEGEVA